MKRELRQDRPQDERLAAYPLRVLAPLLLMLALGAVAVAGYWLKRPADAIAVSCADPLAGCTLSHRGVPVSVRFLARPAPMEAFGFSVTAPGASKVSAEFQMVGMKMGFNRYDLRPGTGGEFAARITLPVCVSGQAAGCYILKSTAPATRYPSAPGKINRS